MFRSIKTKITALFLGIVILMFLALGISGYLLIKKHLLSIHQSQLEFIAHHFGADIRHFLDDRKNVLQKVAESKTFESYPQNHRDFALAEFFSTFQNDLPVVSYIGEDGVEEVKTIRGEMSEGLRDYSDRRFIQDARRTPNKILAPLLGYSDDLEEAAVTLVLAKHGYFGDEFIGIAMARFPLSEFSALLSEVKAGKTGFASIVDEQGAILAHAHKEKDADDHASVFLEFFADAEDLQGGFGRAPILGIDSIVAHAPVGILDWSLVVALPYEEFMEGPRKMLRLVVVIFVIVGLVGIFITIVLTGRISKPITQLASVSRKIAQGDLSRKVEIKSNDEIGELASSFNKMVESLNDSRDLLVSEGNYIRNIIAGMLDTLMVVSPDGQIQTVNNSLCDLLGYEERELIGQPIGKIVEKDSRFDARLTKDSKEKSEKNYISRSGKKIPVLFSRTMLRDERGALLGIVCMAHDVTKRKQAEEAKHKALLEVEEKSREIDSNRVKLKTALAEISALIDKVVKEKAFDVRFYNSNFKKCYELLSCNDQECPFYGTEGGRCWEERGSFSLDKEKCYCTQKGRECAQCSVYQELTRDPLYQIGEQFNNMMHIIENKNRELEDAYSKLKSSQAQMLQREKMASIGQLAAGVAHEINNPMGFISSNLGTLGKYLARLTDFINAQAEVVESLNSTEATERLQGIQKSLKLDFILKDIEELLDESLDGADRVKKIVQNLKSFSRLDETEYKAVDINGCIETTLNIIWNELKYKATVEKDYGDLPLTGCYPQELNQVFMNLLVNAAQAIEKQGVIKLKTWSHDGAIHVSISDTGKGIPEDKLGKIFEPFFTTKEVGEGTGLGLSICYDIVKKHNGEITVVSEVGKGTTFTVTIPVAGIS